MATTTTKTNNLDKMLKEMLAQYENTPVYTPKTDEELKAQAQDEYQSYYDLLRQTARQKQEQNDLALQQQREGLQRTYDQQREESAKQYRQAYSKADRQMLGRGMQRSTYAAQTLANIDQQGVEAQQKLYDAQGAAEGNIDAQRAQLAQQLADQLTQYDNSQATDVMNRIRQLQDQDYTRAQESQANKNALVSSIYNMLINATKAGINVNGSSGSSSAATAATAASAGSTSSSGGSGGGGSYYSGGSSSKELSDFEKERQASIAAIKAGILKAGESPLTTLGSPAAVNNLYKQLIDAQSKSSTSSSKKTSTASKATSGNNAAAQSSTAKLISDLDNLGSTSKSVSSASNNTNDAAKNIWAGLNTAVSSEPNNTSAATKNIWAGLNTANTQSNTTNGGLITELANKLKNAMNTAK